MKLAEKHAELVAEKALDQELSSEERITAQEERLAELMEADK